MPNNNSKSEKLIVVEFPDKTRWAIPVMPILVEQMLFISETEKKSLNFAAADVRHLYGAYPEIVCQWAAAIPWEKLQPYARLLLNADNYQKYWQEAKKALMQIERIAEGASHDCNNG